MDGADWKSRDRLLLPDRHWPQGLEQQKHTLTPQVEDGSGEASSSQRMIRKGKWI